MTSRVGRLRPNSGFTLLEIVIVVILIALVMTLVVPRLVGTFGSASVTSGARQVASMLRYARGRAVMDRLRYRVELDLKNGEYWLAVETDPIRKRGVFQPTEGNVGGRRKLPGSAVFGEFRNNARTADSPDREDQGGPRGDGVVFYPDGRGDSAQLVVQDEKERFGYTIEVMSALGRIVLREGIEEDLR